MSGLKKKFSIDKGIYLCLVVFSYLLPAATLAAADEPKRTLKDNNEEVYHVLPENAATLTGAFAKGVFYGRLRMNYFYWDFEDSDQYDPTGFAVGGSVIYKTAPLHGVSATAGFYTAQNLGLLDKDDALYGRSGKDTFSRYDVLKDGDWGMTVLAQAYFQYHLQKTDIKIGRQIVESFLTKSNDTKMIPNTFEGYTLLSNDLPDTTVQLAYLTAQKLRDHTEFHDVITYGDGNTLNYEGKNISNWTHNDDSAVHKGLSYTNLKNAGEDVDHDLVIAGVTNKSVKNLQLDAWYTGVPDLFYSLTAESNYEIPLIGGWSLTPGLRYMQQFDDGAGDVGGAALNGSLAGISGSAKGYEDANSVDGRLYAARLVLKKGAGSVLGGYSKISDDADLIAPWRGFPTSGYTRSMAQYNWEANTESWMIQASYDFEKAGIIKGFRAAIDYVYMDYDDEKEQLGGLDKTDLSYVHGDMWYKMPFLPDLEAKVRIGLAEADEDKNGLDPSYAEFRFELNYLF